VDIRATRQHSSVGPLPLLLPALLFWFWTLRELVPTLPRLALATRKSAVAEAPKRAGGLCGFLHLGISAARAQQLSRGGIVLPLQLHRISNAASASRALSASIAKPQWRRCLRVAPDTLTSWQH